MAARIAFLLFLVAAVTADNNEVRADGPVQVCYYDSRAAERSQPGLLKPGDIDPKKCTHLVYTFLEVKETGELTREKPEKMKDDLVAFKELKKKNKNLLLMIGIKSFGKPFITVVKEKLDVLVENIVKLVQDFELIGVDLFTHDFTGKEDSDIIKLTPEICQLIEKLKSKKISIVTATFHPVPLLKDQKVEEVKRLIKTLDLLHLATYNFNVYRPGKLTHHTSLEEIERVMTQLEDTITKINDTAVTLKKITLGLATFGRISKLERTELTFIGNASAGPGPAGEITKIEGVLSTFELCTRLPNMTVKDSETVKPPIAFDEKIWISFDNLKSMEKKLRIVKKRGLIGVSIWSVDMDDFSKKCQEKSIPKENRIMTLTDIGTFLREKLTTVGVPLTDVDQLPVSTQVAKPIIRSCYYDATAKTRMGIGAFTPEKIQADLCTHIVYAFGTLSINGRDFGLSQEIIKDLEILKGLKAVNPELKIMLGLKELPQVLLEYAKFGNELLSTVNSYGLDGIDLFVKDWKIMDENMQLFNDMTTLLKWLRLKMEASPFLLTLTMAVDETLAEQFIRLKTLEGVISWINLMTFDLAILEPTLQHHTDLTKIQRIVELLLSKGVDPSMLVMGLVPYGSTFLLKDPNQFQIGSTHMGLGPQGEFTRQPGRLARYEMCNMKLNMRSNELGLTPYGHLGNMWVSFDNDESLRQKIHFALEKQLRGVFVWTIDQDDFGNQCGKGKFPFLMMIKTIIEKRITTVVTKVEKEGVEDKGMVDQEVKKVDKATMEEVVKEVDKGMVGQEIKPVGEEEKATVEQEVKQVEKTVTEETEQKITKITKSGTLDCQGVGVMYYVPLSDVICSAFCAEDMCNASYCQCL